LLNYIVGAIVATIVLGASWVGLEYNAGRSFFDERPLEKTTFKDLLAFVANPRDKNHVEGILELGHRKDDLKKQLAVLGSVAARATPASSQAANIAISELGDKAIPLVDEYFAVPLELDDDGNPTNRDKIFSNRVIGCSLVRALDNQACDKHYPEIRKLLDANDRGLLRCGIFALAGLPERAKECEQKLAELMLELPTRKPYDFNNQIAICKLAMSAKLRSKEMEHSMQKMLVDGNPSVRSWSGVCLGEFVDSPSGSDNAQILADAIDRDHLLVVNQLLVGIAKFGPKAAHVREIVAKKLDHHDQFVRSAAALAITRIDSDLGTLRKEIRKLIKQSQSEQLGINMAMELGDESIEFLDDLIPLTSNEDPIVRESVAIALGQMGPAAKSALSRLEPLSRDEDALVRHAATKAIAKIKSGK
jgi:hypothetical protein